MTRQFSRDEALAHFGVKGMKWGVRRTADKFRANLQTHDQKILKARKDHPALKKNYKAAKAQFKDDKMTVGRKEARRILKESKGPYKKNMAIAQDDTTRELLIKWGAVSVTTLALSKL